MLTDRAVVDECSIGVVGGGSTRATLLVLLLVQRGHQCELGQLLGRRDGRILAVFQVVEEFAELMDD